RQQEHDGAPGQDAPAAGLLEEHAEGSGPALHSRIRGSSQTASKSLASMKTRIRNAITRVMPMITEKSRLRVASQLSQPRPWKLKMRSTTTTPPSSTAMLVTMMLKMG